MIIAIAYLLKSQRENHSGNSQDARAGGAVNRFPTKGNEIRKQDIIGLRLLFAI